jgi:hypothetical protein
MTVAQRVRCLHKDERDPEEDEDKVQTEDNWIQNQPYDRLEAMQNR